MPESLNIPAEVIDLVINEVHHFPEETLRVKTLADTALVSWYFRHRAHTCLFSDISTAHNSSSLSVDRIRRLRELIDADPQSETAGIASYIRSLNVYITGPVNRIRRVLDDGTLAAILRKIFKTNHVGDRLLSLSFSVPGNLRNMFDWETLNADFLSAFYDLCRNPNLTTLHLAHFINLPRTILHHSFVKNIRLSRTRLVEINEEEITEDNAIENLEILKSDDVVINSLEEGQAVPLESIDTDHSLPLLDLIDMTPQHDLHPKLAFSQLKKLTVNIGDEEDFHKTRWILSNAASTLTSLDITLFCETTYIIPDEYYLIALNLANVTLPDPHWRIAVEEMPALKAISIVHNATSYKAPGSTTVPQIAMVLGHINQHPLIEEVKVALFLYTDFQSKTPLNVIDGHDFSPLDQLFSHGRFINLKRLIIRVRFNLRPIGDEPLDLKLFRVESTYLVRKSFAEMSAYAASGRLHFDVEIAPKVSRQAIHRQ